MVHLLTGTEHANIVSPVVGTDDVFTGNMNNVIPIIPMESAMETTGNDKLHI